MPTTTASFIDVGGVVNHDWRRMGTVDFWLIQKRIALREQQSQPAHIGGRQRSVRSSMASTIASKATPRCDRSFGRGLTGERQAQALSSRVGSAATAVTHPSPLKRRHDLLPIAPLAARWLAHFFAAPLDQALSDTDARRAIYDQGRVLGGRSSAGEPTFRAARASSRDVPALKPAVRSRSSWHGAVMRRRCANSLQRAPDISPPRAPRQASTLAVLAGHRPVVELLLDSGVDIGDKAFAAIEGAHLRDAPRRTHEAASCSAAARRTARKTSSRFSATSSA